MRHPPATVPTMESTEARPGPLAGRLLAGCDGQQREAITSPARPLCVLAGAGSGKTRVLTRRIAWRVNEATAAASYVLALTFTRKAAAELKRRLSALGLPEPATAGTFHSVAFSELRRLAAERGRLAPVVLGSKARLLVAAAGREAAFDRESLASLATEIEWAQAQCLTPRDYERRAAECGRQSSLRPALVTEVWRRYEREKQRRGVVDFDDLLLGCAREMENDAEFAASARWRFRHIFVDEYQDVNPAQLRLLSAWLGQNDDLCVVGDPDQAIYAWNGSDPRALVEFPERHPGATVIRLETNYRSSDAVLTVASSVLRARLPGLPDEPDGAIGPASGPISAGLHPEHPAHPPVAYDTDLAEARGVVASLRRARRPGTSWSALAILARTNAQLSLFERELEAAGVPYRSGGGRSFLLRGPVKKALATLATGADATGLRDWLQSLDGSSYPAGDSGDAKGFEDEEEDEESDGRRLGETQDAELEELRGLGWEYVATDRRPTAEGFLSWLETSLRSDPPRQAGDAVDLMTFHRAKGLEWRVVFVTGLEDGFVPIAHARTTPALAEERRLLYVACTRAIDELHCSWARERSFGEVSAARRPSPYLSAIEAACEELASAGELSPERSRASQLAVRALLEGRRPVRRES